MLEEFIVSSYLLASSWIYGYFVIRRAFWVVRLVPTRQRMRLALIFGLPLVLPFAVLLWLVPPMYLFAALAVAMFAYSYYIQTHPKYLMRELLSYIGIRELVRQQPSEQDIRVMILKQRLMRGVELNKDLIDKISEEIKMLRETLKSMEAAQTQTKLSSTNPSNQMPRVNNLSTMQNVERSQQATNSEDLLTDRDLAVIQEKIKKLRKKYQIEE
jgi:hypothetical protein